MEITLTNSNSLKIISGNCTLITNPSLNDEYNIGLFNDPLSNIQNNNLNVKTPGEFEIDNFYITSVGYKTSSKNNENEIDNKESKPPNAENLLVLDFFTCLSLYTKIGTPITGTTVCDAIIPGKWAAPPAPAIITLNP